MEILVETVEKLIAEQSVSFISSVDEHGYPNTKAMLPPAKREGIKTMYWHTHRPSMKVKQYLKNHKACVYFSDNKSFCGVMLKGTMEVVDDIALKKEIWKDSLSMYYYGGMNSDDFIILKFTAETGRYHGNFKNEDFVIE